MKRREFIQTIAVLGVGAALPGINVVAAPSANVATAAASAAPAATAPATLTFFVDALGNLSFGNEPPWQKTRAEALGLCPVCSRAGLEALMQGGSTFAQFARRRQDARRLADPSVHTRWHGWIRDADDAALADEIAAANAWMLEEADAEDLELADTWGLSERGAAMAFFRDHFGSSAVLGIKFVDGEYFQSAERTATLGMSVDEANALAAARNISIRFEPQAVDMERLEALKRLAAESRPADQGGAGPATRSLADGETVTMASSGVALHPLYHHPRIAAVREAVHGMGVGHEYKARLYHSLYAYADQVVTRPIYAPEEGWSDWEAIQQVTLEDMMGRWGRIDSFRYQCESPSTGNEAASGLSAPNPAANEERS